MSSAASDTAGRTTLEQTIVRAFPGSGFGRLTTGPGEPRHLREELGRAAPGRASRRRSLIYFAQLSDFQLVDEESPARVEALDTLTDPAPFAAAWRPQEALGAFAADRAIDQINRLARSPVAQAGRSRARMRLAFLTGDGIDNQQRNEAIWLRTLLEGGVVSPNSGTGSSPGCPTESLAHRYWGVQDYDDYAESPDFYDPDRPAGRYAAWPRWPGLMERAQQPFAATGLRVPSYIAFGNHDRLVQGNEAAPRSFEDIASGCLKPLQTFADPRTAITTLTPAFLAQALVSNPSQVMQVPPDPARQFLSAEQYKQVMRQGSQADGHGFGLVDRGEEAASDGAAGYYSFSPARGVRFVVMNANAEAGIAGPGAAGNLDDPQFRWLDRTLRAARARDELVLAFSHTPARFMTTTLPDEVAPPCAGSDGHGHGFNPGCDADPRDSRPVHTGDDAVALLKRFPNVIAWVAGDSHENKLIPYDSGAGGFWSIETASIADMPQQSRLIELMENGDGTLSIFGTTVNTSAPTAAPSPGSAAGFSEEELAALSRTLAYNDPQAAQNGRPGTAADRNVELVLRDPRRSRCFDRLPPWTAVSRRGTRLTRGRIRISGLSRDRGCPAARSSGRVARVDVAVGRHAGRGRCRFLTRRGWLSQARPCRRPLYIRARVRYSSRARASRWLLRRPVRLPRGRYVVMARARDPRRNVERQRPRGQLHRRILQRD